MQVLSQTQFQPPFDPRLLEQIYLVVRRMFDNQLVICSPNNEFVGNPSGPAELINCSIVRGEMLRLTRIYEDDYIDIVRVTVFYSHTSTDCPECSPEEIRRLDEESEKPIVMTVYNKLSRRVLVFWVIDHV